MEYAQKTKPLFCVLISKDTLLSSERCFFLQHYPTYISALYSHIVIDYYTTPPSNLLANLLVIKNPYPQRDGSIPSVQVVNLSISYEAKLITDPLDT